MLLICRFSDGDISKTIKVIHSNTPKQGDIIIGNFICQCKYPVNNKHAMHGFGSLTDTFTRIYKLLRRPSVIPMSGGISPENIWCSDRVTGSTVKNCHP